ncbi:MAG: hypothetical protein ACI9MC_000698 [Kiritimatiellia bacterium]|jgi:hypothetical protein
MDPPQQTLCDGSASDVPTSPLLQTLCDRRRRLDKTGGQWQHGGDAAFVAIRRT